MNKISGAATFSAKLGRIAGSGKESRIGRALLAAGNLIEVDAALSITAGATSGSKHVPSAPGAAPNADTHLLDRSIETVLVTPYRAEVSANAPYAADLEYGTSKMQARPFMRPAVARKKAEATALIQRALKATIDGN